MAGFPDFPVIGILCAAEQKRNVVIHEKRRGEKKGKKNYKAPPRACLVIISFR